jgi:DegV family protein with EDD domain
MPHDFLIASDIICDLPKEWYAENDAVWLRHGVLLDGVEYWDEFGSEITPHALCEKLRAGQSKVSTLQGRLEDFVAVFTAAAEAGRDVLYVGFSSGLSGTYNTALIAANEVREAHPGCGIYCVDSLGATMGHGIQVLEAARLRAEGLSAAETAERLADKVLTACHFFTVDDLNHLYRGGRLSKTTAFVGSLMGIKPVMYVSDAGKLTPLSKARGRLASMKEMARLTAEYIRNPEGQTIYINHGDVLGEAEELAAMVRAALPGAATVCRRLSPIIVAHSGPGTLAIFFWGEKRL